MALQTENEESTDPRFVKLDPVFRCSMIKSGGIQSDPENASVVLTAGHRGIKFWHLRDPFQPLWGLQPVQRNIYCLEWLSDPRNNLDCTLTIKSHLDVFEFQEPQVLSHANFHAMLLQFFTNILLSEKISHICFMPTVLTQAACILTKLMIFLYSGDD